mgnify:CR=1 FL=1
MVLQSIGTYFGFGPQRNVNLNKETKKSPEFKNLEQIGEQFGYDTKLPVLGNLSVKEFAAQNQGRMIPENKEVITRKGKEFLVDKDRPKGPSKILAGVMDFFDPEADRDKLGGMGVVDDKGRYAYDPTGGLEQFDPKDYSKIQLNPGEIRKATKEFKQEIAGPTSGLEEQIKMLTGSTGDDLIDFYSKAGKRAAGDAFQQYALTEPIRQAYNQRAANIAQQRLLDARGVLEQMPSSVQDIMSKKQEQILKSQVGAADLNRSIADQQDAATRMAGLGMQQKFGQNVVFTPPLLRG